MLMLMVWGSYFQGHCIRVTTLASPGPSLTFPQGKRHIFLRVPYGSISGLPALSILVGSRLALKSLGSGVWLSVPGSAWENDMLASMFYNPAFTSNRTDKDVLQLYDSRVCLRWF